MIRSHLFVRLGSSNFRAITPRNARSLKLPTLWKPPEKEKKGEEKKKPMIRTDDQRRKKPDALALRQAAEIERKTLYFDEIREDLRNKATFQLAIASFLQRDIRRANHVDFIYAALKRMKAFGVHKDLEVYKDILNVFPKGKFIAQNMWQVEFMHYPRHQDCAIDVLCEMEHNAVIPDIELYHIILNSFGDRSIVMRKLKRMFYWLPKFKHANPYPVPMLLPKDPLEQARLALERMSPDLRREITTFQTSEIPTASDKTWVASCICPDQRELISNLPPDRPLFVEGEFQVYLRDSALKYFILRDELDRLLEPGREHVPAPHHQVDTNTDWDLFFKTEKPKEFAKEPSVHEQDNGKILGMCITGSATKDSLVSWMAYLSRTNPELKKRPIVFRLRSAAEYTDIIPTESEQVREEIVMSL
ncbi:evolutionarily conserved signaling intermediate in Toll pathway, mitochondrial-like [Paramacrobiotus metropolitanus]|uniref:evolutionarily conserved signaling intermediate in Toll pathway, mitochondrial-like n=1 Tax=Paramacrobiotus metropolitanus TaxID=2943436 RepID=UPI00244650DF|nr:evolutionarily conserved signaling intermediate in Toll pathway, mitochondrial-like [Paramacrobiotus metropolitanus]